MKKILAVVLACVLMVIGLTTASAAGKVNVSKENFYVLGGYSTYGYVFAKVENVGDKQIKVNAGVAEFYDVEGDVLSSTDWMYAYAENLKPGEYTYVRLYDELECENTTDCTDYMLTITGKSDASHETLRYPCESTMTLGVSDGYWKHNYVYATVTNNTEETVYDVNLVFALLDAEDNILYLNSETLYNTGILPGGSLVVRQEVDSTFMEYFESKGITPAKVDAIAYLNVDVD